MIFEQVAQRLSDVRTPLGLFAEYAADNVEHSFRTETEPDGSRFVPLNKDYARRKKGPSILTESAELRENVESEITGNMAIVGPNKSIIYHAVHQGKTDRNTRGGTFVGHGAFVPARPYVGAIPQDASNFAHLLLGHLRGLTDTTL